MDEGMVWKIAGQRLTTVMRPQSHGAARAPGREDRPDDREGKEMTLEEDGVQHTEFTELGRLDLARHYTNNAETTV
ncbi:hypothetical protein C0Q70_10390 [Pomacea canaliculata]|uniref:Uncharacterized protein n=1 Tax=Pomacea canaliculata TaxID=400727 RepID=A0A2T7PCH6_POMCA|nr:hypothetical protein C0Q70_10390 [Pomacea canaliculata]